jgi:ectoine hydroxylase-related dioxygenase (phytanoyl-CoA dioxygenase family)
VATAPVSDIETDGFTIIPDVVSIEDLQNLRESLSSTMDDQETPRGGNVFLGTESRRLFNLLSFGVPFDKVPLINPLLDTAEQLLGRDLLLSSLTGFVTYPGQTPQPIHADDAGIPLTRPHMPLAIVGILALTDFTKDNGGTRVVPRSHVINRRPTADDDVDTTTIEMSAGSLLVYNGSIWHGGSANNSDSVRMGIICNFCAGWIRQEENLMLGLSRDLVAQFDPRLRKLVGYNTFRGLRGHVAGVNPLTWFPDSEDPGMVWDRIR